MVLMIVLQNTFLGLLHCFFFRRSVYLSVGPTIEITLFSERNKLLHKNVNIGLLVYSPYTSNIRYLDDLEFVMGIT